MLSGDEFSNYGSMTGRTTRLVSKTKNESSVTDLIPTLFDMAKTVMKIKCSMSEKDTDKKTLEEFSNLESAIIKMTSDIESLRRKGH